MSDEPSEATEPVKAPGAVARLRTRGKVVVDRATSWVEDRRGEVMPVDLAVQFYERDRDSFASVLGAAIALRLFLFFVPVVLLITGLVMMIAGHDGVKSLADNAGVTGSLATQIDQATTTSKTTTYGLVLAGIWLTIWAGRSLTKVLAACSAGAWRLGGRQGRATLRMAGSVTTMTLLLLITAALLNRVKDNQGIAVITTSWLLAVVIYAVAGSSSPPRCPGARATPGRCCPGPGRGWRPRRPAVVHAVLPAEQAGDHDGAGRSASGPSVAALGYMFLIGRVMASSLILDAVVFDRIGSISELVFALPVLNRIPRRFPWVARYFDLEREGIEPEPEPAAAETAPLRAPLSADPGSDPTPTTVAHLVRSGLMG